MSDQEYIYPNDESQKKILYFLILILFAVLLALMISYSPNMFLFAFPLILFVTITFSFLLFKLGNKILSQKQYPPENFPVLIKTKIQRGKLAIAQAVASFFGGFLFSAISVFLIYMAWLSVRT